MLPSLQGNATKCVAFSLINVTTLVYPPLLLQVQQF